ncbi:MAG: flavin reductase [Lachnospiraceae bacterium]|nr:flavin reductase [Lachnospiraceae bacterium]
MNQNALFQIGYGLYLVAANENGKDNACIVNTVMQVTQNPIRLLVSVSNQNLTHDMIKNTGKLTVSVLTEKTPFSVYSHFGYQSGKKVDKFEDFEDVTRCANGCYRLNRNSSAYFCGTVSESFALDTHTLFLVEVTDADIVSTQTPVTYDFYQKYVKQPYKPVAKKSGVEKTNANDTNGAGKEGSDATTNSYVCKICGYVYEGEFLPEDYICPICKHGAADFEQI